MKLLDMNIYIIYIVCNKPPFHPKTFLNEKQKNHQQFNKECKQEILLFNYIYSRNESSSKVNTIKEAFESNMGVEINLIYTCVNEVTL